MGNGQLKRTKIINNINIEAASVLELMKLLQSSTMMHSKKQCFRKGKRNLDLSLPSMAQKLLVCTVSSAMDLEI